MEAIPSGGCILSYFFGGNFINIADSIGGVWNGGVAVGFESELVKDSWDLSGEFLEEDVFFFKALFSEDGAGDVALNSEECFEGAVGSKNGLDIELDPILASVFRAVEDFD